MFIKICGITNAEDAQIVAKAGANALGFVFVPVSPRYVTPAQATSITAQLPPHILRVGLFVDAPLQDVHRVADFCRLTHVQLHGHESPAYCLRVGRPVLKAFRVRNQESLKEMAHYDVSAYLLDAYVSGKAGGTGETFNWRYAVDAKAQGRIVLAGGLTPENVAAAIATVQPYGVDVSSGVERIPGHKDAVKVRDFIRNARMA